MEGLTINTAQTLLNTGSTTKEINSKAIAPQAPTMPGVDSQNGGFASSLKNAINSVNQAQLDSDRKMQELATGKTNNIHETMIAAEKAELSFQLMVRVRNKIIDAYQEVMKMQV